MKKTIYILFILLLIYGCGSTKKGAPKDTRYQRKPIVEVSAEQLAADGQQIDAMTQQLLGKNTEAMEGYRKLIAKTPDYAAAHYEMGRLMLQMGWTDSALIYTQRACELDKDNVWYQLQMTKVYERQRDSKNLIATWESIVKQHPDVVDYYYDLSNAYLLSGDVPGSIAVLDRVEKRYGVTEMVSLQKQKLWSAIERPDKARKELEKLAAAMPNEPSYSAILAQSYMQEKDYAKALQYYAGILEASPNDENAHISMAECHLAMGNYDEAYKHLRTGLKNPALDCKTRMLYIGEMLRNERFFASHAQQLFLLADTLVAGCPDNDGHAYHYGLLLASQKRYNEASEQIAKHLEYDSSQYMVWEALLLCESQAQGRDEQLMQHALRAAELFPLHSKPYLVLCELYRRMGDCPKALYYMERCLMVQPNNEAIKQFAEEIKQSCQ